MNCPVCNELMEQSLNTEHWGCRDCGVVVTKEDAVAANGRFYRAEDIVRGKSSN